MLYRVFVALVFFYSLAAFSQSIDPGKVATVHAYLQGELLADVSLFADGNNVASLIPNQIATFYLYPGFHELTLQSGEPGPSVLFKAESGREYFFQLKYEHVFSATSIRDLSMSLTIQPNVPAADELREAKIDPGKLMQILETSNPQGLEPQELKAPAARPAE